MIDSIYGFFLMFLALIGIIAIMLKRKRDAAYNTRLHERRKKKLMETVEKTAEKLDYNKIVKNNIKNVKKAFKKKKLDPKKLLKAEKRNKNRKTLKAWLKEKTKSK